jgi:TetR/AcrR family transcriptional regulator
MASSDKTIVRQPRSTAVRERLLSAALEQFSTVGFEAASTREIAATAGTHQPQINYHFGSKEALWRAVIDQLFAELDASLVDVSRGEPHVVLADICRSFVRFASQRPELNRIIVHESTAETERLAWLVDRHIQVRFDALSALCSRLDPASVPTTDPVIFYYCLVGASSLLSVNAKEAAMLVGGDPVTHRIEAHAAAVALMLLGPEPRSRTTRRGPAKRR